MSTFMGVPVQVSALAYKTTRYPIVQRCVPPKRRKRWTLTYRDIMEPCAYRLANGTLVMHPDIYRQICKQNESVYDASKYSRTGDSGALEG